MNVYFVVMIINKILMEKKRFLNIYKLSNHHNNKFILFLWKEVYPYEYMDDWENLNETSSPEKEDFYNHLNRKDTTDADYTHAKRVWN